MLPGLSVTAIPALHRGITPGSEQHDSGSGIFIVPVFEILTIEVWGGGACGGDSERGWGGNGVVSTVVGGGINLSAGGGTTSTGGVASGGNTDNLNGRDGTADRGGNSGDDLGVGGDLGATGTAPGGGGGPDIAGFYGGGGGAKVKHVLTAGQIAVGTSLSWAVGPGGLKHPSAYSGDGAYGRVKFSWQ